MKQIDQLLVVGGFPLHGSFLALRILYGSDKL
jgi:hypothetical protein